MRLFGTDGIRGIAGQYPLDDQTIQRIGSAAAAVLKGQSAHNIVIIGRDTRESGERIADILSRSFAADGIEVWNVGIVPTPAVAYLASRHPVLAGIVISASHNPYKDNGIKFFGPTGTKLPDAMENLIEEKIHADPPAASGAAKGAIEARASLAAHYVDFLSGTLSRRRSFDGASIVLDCANGATSSMAPALFSACGARVTAINHNPDGTNINRDSGSLHPETLAAEVARRKAVIGLAFDGDGDRVIFVDETGVVRDGDYILALTANFLKSKKELINNTLVTTVMANLGLFHAMDGAKIDVIKTAVGDRYVYEGMLQSGAIVGGEQSGHLIFKNFLSTGDGMLSALQVLSIMNETGSPLSKLCAVMEKYPQVLVNTRVKRKIPVSDLARTAEVIKDAEAKLRADGRVLVRYSGTENLLRVMIEGHDKALIAQMAGDIAQAAVKEIESMN